ncbi:hypothetical protein CRM22_000345, partial [Opisthorchis felineus]
TLKLICAPDRLIEPVDKPYDETIDVPDSEDIVTPRSRRSPQETMDEYEDRETKPKKRTVQGNGGQFTVTPPLLT